MRGTTSVIVGFVLIGMLILSAPVLAERRNAMTRVIVDSTSILFYRIQGCSI